MKKKLLITSIILALTFIGCGASGDDNQTSDTSSTDVVADTAKDTTADTITDTTNDAGENVAGDTATDTSETSKSDDSKNAANANTTEKSTAKPEGKYSMIFTEELEGKEVSAEFSYTFNADGTGVYNGQDTIDFTWDDKFIYTDSSKYPYVLKDNCLSVTDSFGTDNFYKK